jgi:thiol-disulfide isomerase/thioredoxin
VPLLFVLLLVGPTACSNDEPEPEDGVDLQQDDLTSLEFDGPSDAVVTLADYEGRPVVVNLFASWCAPCVSEMPAIERVKQDVGDQVAFVGVAVNDRVEDAEALVEETGVTCDIVRDPFGDAVRRLGTVRMPTTYLISAEGEVVEAHGGALEEDELRELLREHLGIDA